MLCQLVAFKKIGINFFDNFFLLALMMASCPAEKMVVCFWGVCLFVCFWGVCLFVCLFLLGFFVCLLFLCD